MSDSEDQAIREAVFAGKKIEAIKLYRAKTGLGSKEAKDAVDALEAELRTATPERFTRAPAKGCMPLLMVMIGAVVVACGLTVVSFGRLPYGLVISTR